MSSEYVPEWLGVNEAAELIGKSLSTVRRLISEVEAAAPEHVRRSGGNGKVEFRRAYLVQRFGIAAPERTTAPERAPDAGNLVQVLERQIEVKDRQINALQRDIEAKNRQVEQAQQTVGELTESLKQFAALTVGLQNKQIEAGRPSEPAPAGYWLAVSVALSLIACLVVWFVLQWIGGG